ncbi:MAG: hypothetical protein HC881_01265 [Leptolyngbyaceae cyanobacterium SL_7_1]|nr:hypothetical protein [Leptolyngbyaceae cyanobacterium SL_7_1]
MPKKKCLNSKRLSKKQVQALIESEGRFHEEFTKFFEETYGNGRKKQPQIYELPGDRFLFVFDPKGYLLPGEGDIYAKEYFLRLLRWVQRVRDDYANHRGSSVEHWRYYSKHKVQLVDQVDALINQLARCLDILYEQLDYSYKSLDVVSSKAESYGLEKVQVELYDNLVAYVGEVLRRRVKGDWAIRKDRPGDEYPAIDVNGVMLMPINIVWQELGGLEPMNLRKETANEVRRFSLMYRWT